jgi:hypothetical protein
MRKRTRTNRNSTVLNPLPFSRNAEILDAPSSGKLLAFTGAGTVNLPGREDVFLAILRIGEQWRLFLP